MALADSIAAKFLVAVSTETHTAVVIFIMCILSIAAPFVKDATRIGVKIRGHFMLISVSRTIICIFNCNDWEFYCFFFSDTFFDTVPPHLIPTVDNGIDRISFSAKQNLSASQIESINAIDTTTAAVTNEGNSYTSDSGNVLYIRSFYIAKIF